MLHIPLARQPQIYHNILDTRRVNRFTILRNFHNKVFTDNFPIGNIFLSDLLLLNGAQTGSDGWWYTKTMRSIAQQAIIANLSSCLSNPEFLPPWSAELSAVCPCCLRFFSYKPASTTSVRLSPFDSPDSFNLWWLLWKSLPLLLPEHLLTKRKYELRLLLSLKSHTYLKY